MSEILITIGITAFNAVDTIRKAVASAISQTWRPIEIIVVDDCSTDGTWEVLKQVAKTRKEMRVFRNNSNQGVAYTRNRIIFEAKGEFIAFFDDDDVSLPERIHSQLKRILSYEQHFARGAPVVSYTARKVIYPDGKILIQSTMGEREGVEAPHGYPVAERILLGTYLKNGYGACPTCSQMIRKTVLQDLGGFDPAFRRSEDTELNIRLAKKGGHFVGIAKPMMIQKMTLTFDKDLHQENYYALKMLEKHRDIPDRYDMYDFCRDWIQIRQTWFEREKLLFAKKMGNLMLKYPWHTCERLILSIPNYWINHFYRRFHRGKNG